jgi:hypothetical protein
MLGQHAVHNNLGERKGKGKVCTLVPSLTESFGILEAKEDEKN